MTDDVGVFQGGQDLVNPTLRKFCRPTHFKDRIRSVYLDRTNNYLGVSSLHIWRQIGLPRGEPAASDAATGYGSFNLLSKRSFHFELRIEIHLSALM